jgi:hypothetical protein
LRDALRMSWIGYSTIISLAVHARYIVARNGSPICVAGVWFGAAFNAHEGAINAWPKAKKIKATLVQRLGSPLCPNLLKHWDQLAVLGRGESVDLKAGITIAGKMTTVSANYRRCIQRPPESEDTMRAAALV